MGLLSYSTEGKIGYVTLTNDKQRNALSLELIHQFEALLLEIKKAEEINVLVIQAEGKVFSAGHNLREIDGHETQEVLHLFNECHRFMETLRNMPQVTIAKVDGLATAAGCQLVAICDMAVATEQSLFATPGVHVGFFCSTPAVFLSRNVGRKKAAEMLFTGEPITAEDALASGLINRIVAKEELDEAVAKLAESVARHSYSSLSIGKKGFYQQLQMEDFQALNYASEIMATHTQHVDAKEGIRAFIEKRKPTWSDR